MKAQLSEPVGFVLFVVAIIIFMVLSRIFILGNSVYTLSTTIDRNENERLKAASNALFLMKEERTELPLLDLLGRGVADRTDIIVLGPDEPQINISEELEWRLNAMFGKNNWHMKIPFPERIEFSTQIVIVADMSSSLCDDLNEMKKLPLIIEDMNKKGKKVFATLYMLGQSSCFYYNYPEIVCSDFETEHFKCRTLLLRDNQVCKFVGLPGANWDTKEDWGNGIACAAETGPVGGWAENSVRLGIIITDELSGGSECSCSQWQEFVCGAFMCKGCVVDDACKSCDVGIPSNQFQSVENGLRASTGNNMSVFGLLANPCGDITAPGTGFEFICHCEDVLKNHLSYIAVNTSGSVFALKNSSQVSSTIIDIIIKSEPHPMNEIDIGAPLPSRSRIRSHETLVPVAAGNYTKARLYSW